jgi:hypothetical protein
MLPKWPSRHWALVTGHLPWALALVNLGACALALALPRCMLADRGRHQTAAGCVVGEEGHESGRPHRIRRTERAPSADLLGCVSACVAAGLRLESERKNPKKLRRAATHDYKEPGGVAGESGGGPGCAWRARVAPLGLGAPERQLRSAR